MELSASTNIAQFRRMMEKEKRSQLPFATAKALTMTGKDAREATEGQIAKVFDRPTSFTRRAVVSFAATKARMYSRVLIKDKQAEYLGIQERGGTRTPRGRAIVVPVGARLNQYGNIARGGIRRMLARDDTFSGTVRGIGGIWQRQRGGGVKLLVAYEPKAEYQPRFEFAKTVQRTASERFAQNFDVAFREAMATAR